MLSSWLFFPLILKRIPARFILVAIKGATAGAEQVVTFGNIRGVVASPDVY